MSHRTRRPNPRDVSMSPTGLLPSLAALSSGLWLSRHFLKTRGHPCRDDEVGRPTPPVQRLQPFTHRWFGLVPVRSPLLGESLILISFPPGTEMFQFSGFASYRLCIQRLMTGLVSPTGFPIGTSTDPGLFGGSPWLFAAFHVLHRWQTPRHPPYALCRLTIASPLSRLNPACTGLNPPAMPSLQALAILRRISLAVAST